MSNHNINTVKKPWGYEYLAYENENVGLWFLYIAPGQSTSMHCHPKKTTGLVLLDGEAEISLAINVLFCFESILVKENIHVVLPV